jgi:hypothetical protein
LLNYRTISGSETFSDAGKIQFQVYLPEPASTGLVRTPSKPMSKPRGILEIMRFQWMILWRRLTQRVPTGFNNLPGINQS